MKDIKKEQLLFIGSFVLVIFYLFWDIGNLSGIRQGTEALYLQVSKEMFEAGSFLTPLYRGEHHWSKPPLHFWLPFPLYQLSGGYSLLMARAAVAIFTITSVIYISFKLKKEILVSFYLPFFIFIGSMGIFKFSRTFMMEIPFSILPMIAMFIFWDYLQNKKKVYLMSAVVFLALSVLIKGPITIVMSFLGLLSYQIYLLYSERKSIFKECFYLLFLSTMLASSWFALCYIEYGQEFFDYFFIRENMGKFGQKSMPSIKLVQGLLLYILPWLYAIPLMFSYIAKDNKAYKNIIIYFFSLSLGFFFIWFFPAQKSHHYALPVLPFILTLLVIVTHEVGMNSKIIKWGQLPIVLLFIVIELLLLYFSTSGYEYIVHFVVLITWMLASYFYMRRNGLYGILFSTMGFILFWVLSLNTLFLPVVPPDVVQLVKQSEKVIFLNDRRSYFFEEALGTRVKAVSVGEARKILSEDAGYIIVYEARFGRKNIEQYNIIAQWKKWIRKVKWKNVVTAIRERNIHYLQENIYILSK